MRNSRENSPSDSTQIREKFLRAGLAGSLALSAAIGLGACDEKVNASNEPAPIETTQSEVTPQSTPAETAPVQEPEPQEELADVSKPICEINYDTIYTTRLDGGEEWSGTIYDIAALISGLDSVSYVDLHNIVGEFMNRNIDSYHYEPVNPYTYIMRDEESAKRAANDMMSIINFMRRLRLDDLTEHTPSDLNFDNLSRVVAKGSSTDNEAARELEDYWNIDREHIYVNDNVLKRLFDEELNRYSTSAISSIEYLGEADKVDQGDARIYALVKVYSKHTTPAGTIIESPTTILLANSPGGLDYGGRP